MVAIWGVQPAVAVNDRDTVNCYFIASPCHSARTSPITAIDPTLERREGWELAAPVKKTDAVAAGVGYGHGVGTHCSTRPIGVADRRRSQGGEASRLDTLQ